MILKEFNFKQTGIQSWNEIFAHPRPITLKIIKTGKVVINRRGTINPDHPDAGNVPSEDLEVPIISYLVHHEDKGYYLLDAGLDALYHLDPHGGLEGSDLDEFYLGVNENIAYYLNAIKLNGIYFSHLHADHAAGQRELSKDVPHVVGKGEYDDYHPEIHGDFLEGMEILQVIDFSEADFVPPLGFIVDLLGDGSLWAISTPGHTRGHISFLLNGSEGPVFLTMDAAFIYENLEYGVAPSDYTWDVDLAQKTLENIIKFLEEYPQVKVGAGHEVLK